MDGIHPASTTPHARVNGLVFKREGEAFEYQCLAPVPANLDFVGSKETCTPEPSMHQHSVSTTQVTPIKRVTPPSLSLLWITIAAISLLIVHFYWSNIASWSNMMLIYWSNLCLFYWSNIASWSNMMFIYWSNVYLSYDSNGIDLVLLAANPQQLKSSEASFKQHCGMADDLCFESSDGTHHVSLNGKNMKIAFLQTSHFQSYISNNMHLRSRKLNVILFNHSCSDLSDVLDAQNQAGFNACREEENARRETFIRFAHYELCTKANLPPQSVLLDIPTFKNASVMQALFSSSYKTLSCEDLKHQVVVLDKGAVSALTRIREQVHGLRSLLNSTAKDMMTYDGCVNSIDFLNFHFSVFGRVGSGKSTFLQWLTRHAGAPESVCLKFPNRHSGAHTHTTHLTITDLQGTRIIDTAGLQSLTRDKALGVKILANGNIQEGREIYYVSLPSNSAVLDSLLGRAPGFPEDDLLHYHDVADNTTKAHAILLTLAYSGDYTDEEYHHMREFLDELKQSQLIPWRTNGLLWPARSGTWKLQGYEPVIAVTHLQNCKRRDTQECIRELANNLDLSEEEIFPLQLGDYIACRQHAQAASLIDGGGGRSFVGLCNKERLTFLAAEQFTAILSALAAKARKGTFAAHCRR